jgi:hypothetical protein
VKMIYSWIFGSLRVARGRRLSTLEMVRESTTSKILHIHVTINYIGPKSKAILPGSPRLSTDYPEVTWGCGFKVRHLQHTPVPASTSNNRQTASKRAHVGPCQTADRQPPCSLGSPPPTRPSKKNFPTTQIMDESKDPTTLSGKSNRCGPEGDVFNLTSCSKRAPNSTGDVQGFPFCRAFSFSRIATCWGVLL